MLMTAEYKKKIAKRVFITPVAQTSKKVINTVVSEIAEMVEPITSPVEVPQNNAQSTTKRKKR